MAEANPGLVPVAKGNGYGFGLRRLAREATTLGVDTLAVGTYDELGKVSTRFPGDLMVLLPWRPFGTATNVDPSDRLVHTVSRLEDLELLLSDHDPTARFLVERMTSMLRHGLSAASSGMPRRSSPSTPGPGSTAWRFTCRSRRGPTCPRPTG